MMGMLKPSPGDAIVQLWGCRMSKRERQQRYKSIGAAAKLSTVEVLVPPEGRAQILALAAKLREEYRERTQVDVEAITAKVRQACQAGQYQPRRFTQPVDVDNLVVTSVNVPFPKLIDAETLARAIRRDRVPAEYAGHLGRFLGEIPVADILRFCDRHQIKARALAKFVRGNRAKLALQRVELEDHLDAIVPHP